jgi:hypothetical protein
LFDEVLNPLEALGTMTPPGQVEKGETTIYDHDVYWSPAKI